MQVNFSEGSMRELRKIGGEQLLEVIRILGDLRPEQFLDPKCSERFQRTSHEGKIFYRIPIGDLRFYFEFSPEFLFCRHILARHTFDDFCMRCGFSEPSEQVEENPIFWSLVENEERKG